VVSHYPKLYDVVIEAATDRVQDQIGFRSIEARGAEILLNGRPVFLRGVRSMRRRLFVAAVPIAVKMQ